MLFSFAAQPYRICARVGGNILARSFGALPAKPAKGFHPLETRQGISSLDPPFKITWAYRFRCALCFSVDVERRPASRNICQQTRIHCTFREKLCFVTRRSTQPVRLNLRQGLHRSLFHRRRERNVVLGSQRHQLIQRFFNLLRLMLADHAKP